MCYDCKYMEDTLLKVNNKGETMKIETFIKYSFCMAMIFLMILSCLIIGDSDFIYAASLDTEDAKAIKGSNWESTSHHYSGYDDDKSKAMKVEDDYGFRLEEKKDAKGKSLVKYTILKGKEVDPPKEFHGKELKVDTDKRVAGYRWFYTDDVNDTFQIKISGMTIWQNGKWVDVDLVRTISSPQIVDKYGDGYVAMGTGVANAAYIGLDEITITTDFYVSGTDKKISLKSNLTLTDIDAAQYVSVKADKITGSYVSADTKLLYMETAGREYYCSKDESYQEQAYSAVGFTFETTSFSYKFGRDMRRDKDTDVATRNWQYVESGQSMVNFEPGDPEKTVTDADETEVKDNTVGHLGETWTYNVSQAIPAVAENFYYDSFVFEDTIEECMKILDVKVMASNGTAEKDATSLFTVSRNGNTIKATAKNPKAAAFYQNTVYTLKVKVKMDVPENATETQIADLKSKWKEHGHYSEEKTAVTEKNSAKVIIDGKDHMSNDVTTTVRVQPQKTVSDDNGTDVKENSIRHLAQSWTYKVTQAVAKGASEEYYYDSFSFIDEIEECLKISGVKVKAADGTDVSSWFHISTADNKVIAALKDPKAEAFYAHASYVLEVSVKMDVPENPTEAQIEALKTKWSSHGHYNEAKTVITEHNRAYTQINGINDITNRASTDIRLPEISGNEPGLKVEKSVGHYEWQVGDRVQYTVKADQTNEHADAAYFIIKDTSLPDSLAADMDSVKVSGIDASAYTLSQSGNGWVLTSKGDYALPYGKTVTISYDAVALKASNGTAVDNEASAVAAGIPEKKDGKQVYINSPKIDVEKTAPERNYKVGDTVGYKVTVTNRNAGTFMRNIELHDLVKTDGLEIKEGTIAVMVDGKNMTDRMEISYQEDGRGFDIVTGYNMKNGQIPCAGISPYKDLSYIGKIVVTYDATVTKESGDGSAKQNVFTVPATENTNGDKIKDDPEIPSGGGESTEDISMKSPALDITKKSNKQSYKVGDTGHYTLTVKQTKEETVAKNIVIRDAFDKEKGAEMILDTVIVRKNGSDITKDCKITADSEGFTIATGKDMGDEEEMTVSYDVLFALAGEYTNTAVASSDNTKEDRAVNEVEVTAEASPSLKITKTSDKEQYTLGDIGHYMLSIRQTKDGIHAENVVITDFFDSKKGMTIDVGSLIVKLNGKEITKDCKVETSKGGFTIATGKDLSSDDELAVTYDVVFTASGSYMNTAATEADNADKKETEHIVDVSEKPVLTVIKNADKKTYAVGDEAAYTLTVRQMTAGATAKNIVITDAFEQAEGLKVDEDSIRVKVNGKNITNDCKITVNGAAFTVETEKELSVDDEMTLTYKTAFTKAGIYKNAVVAKADNTDEAKAENEVEVLQPKLTVEKTADKKEYTAGDTGNYTLTVRQMTEGVSAKNVVITDSFDKDKGVTVDEKSLAVKLGEEDITKDCKISVKDSNFTIETGKDLSEGNVITVTYRAVFTASDTYTNTATADADNADKAEADNTVQVASIDVALTKDADKKSYKVGENVNYKVTFSLKKENAVCKDVIMKDTLPDGLELLKGSIHVEGLELGRYTVEVNDNVLIVKIKEMKYGEKVIVTYQAKVLASALGKNLINQVSVTGTNLEPAQTNVSVKVPKTDPLLSGKQEGTRGNNNKTGFSIPKTGDYVGMATYIMGMLVAGIVAFALIHKKEKKNHK